jgi:hypothetical protein
METNIEEDEERATLAGLLNDKVSTVGLLLANILGSEAELGKGTASKEETSGVGSSVILAILHLETKARKLVGIGRGEDNVRVEGGVDYLGDHVLVGETDDKAVLG